jgi:fructokinase
MILSIGEILFDVFPKYRRIGGAPFNFAYHVKGLGLPVRFVSRVGKDEPGWEILSVLSRAGFRSEDVQIDPQRPTGKVKVELDDHGVPTFTIVEGVAYDRLAYDEQIGKILEARPSLIYFGSLVQRTEHGFSTLHKIIESRHPDALCLYDMNLRPGCERRHILERSLQAADILKLNDEELQTAAEMFDISGDGPDSAAALMERFSLSMVALTRGAEGSEIYVGGDRFGAEAPEPANIADTVGAGDAYAAVLAAGVLKRWPPEKILSAAARFSSRVCSIEGAIPDGFSFYREFRDDMEGTADA